MSCRILFGGMSSAGKSTLACSAYEILTRRGFSVGLHELDIWSDTHDYILGRKPWEQRHKRGGPSGDDLHPEFVTAVERFRADDSAVVIGDLPGRDNPSWQAATGCADYAVLVYRRQLAKDGEEFFADHEVDWERQMEDWGIPVIGRVQSLLPGQIDVSGTDRFAVTGLDRSLLLDDDGLLRLTTLITRFAETSELQTA